MTSKLLVPVALGLSLVTVTAFVVYYVFKQDEDDEWKNVKTSRVNVIEISIPKSILPALIGRGGSNIKGIEEKTGALIHFKKFSDKDHDVCIIRGRTTTTQLAETMIHEFIKQQPVIVEDSMEVPGWSCGRIIGTGGENINDISHCSGARVRIESSGDKNTMKQVTFRGTKEQIAHAMELIEKCVAQEKCRREIEQSKRSPRHEGRAPSADREDMPGDVKHVKYKRPAECGGAPIEVYVSAVSSPSRFWVQFVGRQVTQLDELVAKMTDYYNNKENRAAHALSSVSVGQLVAAVFRHDGRWYRARVHDIRPNEFDATQQVADVFFVDYGDSEYVATHELCELKADLLGLRFQAMECFLAGVQPKSDEATGTPRWSSQAVERFEDLAQVARWKPLVSRTCTYKKTATVEGEKEKEIPGIKLFDVTDEGELDIGAALVAEGLAEAAPLRAPAPPAAPYGDLGHSRVLGMLSGGGSRCSSVPKDHKDDQPVNTTRPDSPKENDRMTTSKSHASGLEKADKIQAVSNFDLSYPDTKPKTVNGSHGEFLNREKENLDKEASTDTLVPAQTPVLSKSPLDDFKANINRIDSHHSSLEALGRTHELHK
ncbi:tudor and KH domain-containing protein homolog isoform X1 [Amyelois transitella]|uniref:tudor and KH domain-containing protein homolog isoform X1 n=1 Tax=Amyelois transitella TaxID=680683 RepID=UPI00298F8AF4|nr:tudor and KH domain-containing protein homolog isoform X1 [Amyelois transitella]XP_060804756.1 tudor and KH domain-containing protein homolog isoform X1 [Amyelois transitella]XP_060804757.1 tudor and KH domain-containing protein homolog isoform X1 [Amyelois transitella]